MSEPTQPQPGTAADSVSDDVRTRIIAAAEAIWTDNGKDPGRKPKVADVRARARTDMGAASAVLAEWWLRKTRTAAKVVATPIPEAVLEAFHPVLATAWDTCQTLANANLAAAQASWELEREQASDMRRDLSALWEGVTNELGDLTTKHAEALRGLDEAASERARLVSEIQDLREQLSNQVYQTNEALARVEEIEHRVEDLKAELAASHEETQQVRQELREAREQHLEVQQQQETVASQAIEAARLELAAYRGKAEEVISARDLRIEGLEAKQFEQANTMLELQRELANVTADSAANDKLFNSKKQEMADAAKHAADRLIKLQEARDAASQRATEAETHAAHLLGKVESLQDQNKALLAAIPKAGGAKAK